MGGYRIGNFALLFCSTYLRGGFGKRRQSCQVFRQFHLAGYGLCSMGDDHDDVNHPLLAVFLPGEAQSYWSLVGYDGGERLYGLYHSPDSALRPEYHIPIRPNPEFFQVLCSCIDRRSIVFLVKRVNS